MATRTPSPAPTFLSTRTEIKRVIDPIESFHLQLKEEVESYERLKRGEFDELENLRGLGHLLISLRIAKGISQRDLARRLDVHESQVSRDERNEYFGITLERAIKILDALNVRLHTKVEVEPEQLMAMLENTSSSHVGRCLQRWTEEQADCRRSEPRGQ
jgi:transcriptional regulator with XRE-family HTH domain